MGKAWQAEADHRWASPATALHAAKVDDPDGEAWHGEAKARWVEAELADPETPFVAYVAPALPDWSAKAPAHVTRELLGLNGPPPTSDAMTKARLSD